MQGQAGPFAGCSPRSRSAAEMDGCSRQNPAYRLATEGAPAPGALSICPFTIPFSPAELSGRNARLLGVRSGEAARARNSPRKGWIRMQQGHNRSVLGGPEAVLAG